MKDLLSSVRRRYSTGINFHNLFTLSHRVKRQTVKLNLKTADLERDILRAVNHDMLRHVEQFKQQALRMEKKRFEVDKRVGRQNDLVFANINTQMKRLKRELALLKDLENERREESELTKETIASFASRSAKRLFDEHTNMSSVQMHSEISSITKKAVRNAMRQMREEQDYERRRG